MMQSVEHGIAVRSATVPQVTEFLMHTIAPTNDLAPNYQRTSLYCVVTVTILYENNRKMGRQKQQKAAHIVEMPDVAESCMLLSA